MQSPEIHPVQMTKILRRLPRPTDGTQIRKAPRQEGTGRFFCVSGSQGEPQPGGPPDPIKLKVLFQKLTTRVITPHRSTPGSVRYDLFTPINFTLQPQEQRMIFIDITITSPRGYYAQLMSKSGLTVLYELEVKAGVIDPDYTGNIGVVLKNNSQEPVERVVREPIAQLLFVKVATPELVQTSNLAHTQRGNHGFRTHSTVFIPITETVQEGTTDPVEYFL